MTSQIQRLHDIFNQPGWERFIAAMLSLRNHGRPFPSVVTMGQPTEDERLHHARLLRLPVQLGGVRLRYDLSKISAALAKGGLESDWHVILGILYGPISEKHVATMASKQAWRDFWPRMETVLAKNPFDQWEEWFASLKRDGVLKRLSKGDVSQAQSWVEKASRLLRVMPLELEQSLAAVSAEFCGDSHALDMAMPLSTIVLRCLALRLKQGFPSRSEARREVWAAFGVICDELSAPVLVFNLGVAGDTLLCHLASLAAAENHPLHLTTRLVWSTEWRSIKCPPNVYVCENPTVLSIAANRFGNRCPPLVCVNGEPTTTVRLLLRQLKLGGSQLHYHGDFDWRGIAIARRVMEEFGASSWRFDAAAYLAASHYPGRELTDNPCLSPWSPQLAAEMQQRGIAYDEEVLAEELLAGVCMET